MTIQAIAIGESAVAIVSVVIGTILFVMIYASLQQSKLFGGRTVIVLSLCTTILCLIGMGQMFVPPQMGEEIPAQDQSPRTPFIILPYTMLGELLLIIFILMLIAKVACGRNPRKTLDLPMDVNSVDHMKRQS
ncbi:MAG: hypothetical protein HQ515_15715 [Phycisphaeraceae bacterium]|nr:hypothetical protein [Phycisphaeraceae bacterium]